MPTTGLRDPLLLNMVGIGPAEAGATPDTADPAIIAHTLPIMLFDGS